MSDAVAEIIEEKVETKKDFDDAIDLFKTNKEDTGTKFNRADQGKTTNEDVTLLHEIIGSMKESNKILFVDVYKKAWEESKEKEESMQQALQNKGIKTTNSKLVMHEDLLFQELPPATDKGEEKTRFALIDSKGPKLLIIEAQDKMACTNAWLEIEKRRNHLVS